MSEPIEYGKWTSGQLRDGRAVICSSDFTHDVCLIVNGDFEDDEQKLAYAKMMADRLNSSTKDALLEKDIADSIPPLEGC